MPAVALVTGICPAKRGASFRAIKAKHQLFRPQTTGWSALDFIVFRTARLMVNGIPSHLTAHATVQLMHKSATYHRYMSICSLRSRTSATKYSLVKKNKGYLAIDQTVVRRLKCKGTATKNASDSDAVSSSPLHRPDHSSLHHAQCSLHPRQEPFVGISLTRIPHHDTTKAVKALAVLDYLGQTLNGGIS